MRESKQFQALPAEARLLYICCALESGGRQEFQFSAGAMKNYGIARSTGTRSLKALESAGFIEVLENGHVTRTPNKYRFSRKWMEQAGNK